MSYDLVFALIVLVFVILSCIIVFACYQSVLNKNLNNRKQKKHFPLALYLASIIVIASFGSYGYSFVKNIGKFYFFHPFSATISDDITELNYFDMYQQLQKKSGSDEEFTVKNDSKIKITVNESNILSEMLFNLYGKKNKHDVSFVCLPAKPLDMTCSTQHFKVSENELQMFISAKPYFKKLSEIDFKLILSGMEKRERYQMKIFFHELEINEAKPIYNSYKIENNTIIFYPFFEIFGQYIEVFVGDNLAHNDENQGFGSYIIQL